MAERKIDVTVRGDHIRYSDDALHATKNDTITWECSEGSLAIQFLGVSPLHAANLRSAGKNPLPAPVRMDAQPGNYSYACAVCFNDHVYLDAACPAIIID